MVFAITQTKPDASSSQSVLPVKLAKEIAGPIQESLQPAFIEKGYAWILHNTSDDKDPLALVELFLEHFEKKSVEKAGGVLTENIAVFRAALFALCLLELPRYRMRFAEKGFNYVFLETWLKKNLTAQVMGITTKEVERMIFLSDLKPRDFLNDRLRRLAPLTFLKKVYRV